MRVGSDGWLWSQLPQKLFCVPNRDDLRLELATKAETLGAIGSRLSQHYGGLARLGLKHGAFPLKAKAPDTSWPSHPSPFPSLLDSKFTPFLISLVPSFQYNTQSYF